MEAAFPTPPEESITLKNWHCVSEGVRRDCHPDQGLLFSLHPPHSYWNTISVTVGSHSSNARVPAEYASKPFYIKWRATKQNWKATSAFVEKKIPCWNLTSPTWSSIVASIILSGSKAKNQVPFFSPTLLDKCKMCIFWGRRWRRKWTIF